MLHYELTGSAEKPSLLFLHGFIGSCRDWKPIIGRLQDHFHCIAVDLPGHGQSRCDDPLQFAMPAAAAAVIELLDYLAIGVGGLVGYSMGGRLALYLAVHFPARFSHLVLESSSPGLRTAAERTTRRSWDEAMAHKLETMPLPAFLEQWYAMPLFTSLHGTAEFATMLQKRLENDPAQLVLSLRQMGTGSQPSLWTEWAQLTMPSTLIVGELDAKYVGISAEMHKLNPHSQRIVIPGTGHNVHSEQPQRYAAAIADCFA
ncbi:MAG: 2-succinyl-6-hydroxy-2,4-cyclohexadiene-1-carboxylate synthase [Anaerolineae bacterium]|nr:2-succinyl-6-hydroxy-2,4-cyclohexadiene-1-carboxylate synthase [Anaerolineae bacterium]